MSGVTLPAIVNTRPVRTTAGKHEPRGRNATFTCSNCQTVDARAYRLCAGERDHATGPAESTIENAARQTPVPAPPRKIEAPVVVVELKRAAKN
jgi:hypothetical protein